MLQRQKLVDGFKEVADKNRSKNDQVEQKISDLEEQVGDSLTNKQFQDMAQNIRDNEFAGMSDETAKMLGEKLADFLNSMEDMTGDNPQPPFQVSQTKPIFDAMMEIGDIGVGAVEAQIQTQWTSFFPINFQLQTPPPGSVQKISSIGSIMPLSPVAPVLKTNKDFETFANQLATVFYSSASKIPVIINHTVPSPSGPVPGPPISGIVR